MTHIRTCSTHILSMILAVLALLPAPALRAQTAICTQPIYLRQSACPTGATSCTSKGSTLTWTELDADITNIANMCNYIGTGIVGGSGTVTSVATGTGLTGGPFTTSGTISLDFSATFASNTLAANQCVFGVNGILCEGSSADAFETLLTLTNPTADRTITLPDASGTVAVSATSPVTLSAGGAVGVSITPANPGGAVALQASTPGTQQAGNLNVSGAGVFGGTVSGSNLSGTNTGDQTITLTGDVTGSGTGSFATTIGAGKVTNADLASSYSGVGACGANLWASTLNGNAAPTCTQVGFTNLSGTPTLTQLASVCSGAGNQVVQWNNAGTAACIATPAGGGSGTVTSVAMTVPGVLFSVSGSPVTTSGTLALSLLTQTANTVLAGPTSGGAATPTFRALVAADIPNLTVPQGGTGAATLAAHGVVVGNGTSAVNVTGAGTSGQVLTSNGASADPTFQAPASSPLTSVEPGNTQRVFVSVMGQSNTNAALSSGTAYFVYLGRTVAAVTPKFVEFYMQAAGSGAQTAEVGLFSSPNPPSKAGQSLTLITSTGTVDTLTATTGVKRNTSAFSTSVPSGTHLWAGIRTAMASTQPAIPGLNMDMAEGFCLTTASAAALTTAGPWTGGLVAGTANHTSWTCPVLRVTLD